MSDRTPTARRVLAALLTVLALTAFTALTRAQERRRGGPRVVSPEVSAERKVSFRIVAPSAESVRVSGGDMPEIGRGADLTKGEEGLWEVTLGPVDPGAYRYRFDVDGVPVIDPRNPATSESNNNTWSLVVVPGSDFMDTKDVRRGAVAEVTYYSKSLERFRRMHVYTPPGYEKSTETYPIFYLLHGASDCDDSWTSVGRAGFILDNLIAEGSVVPMVVAMPAGHTGASGFGRRGDGPRVDEFAEDFLKDLMPYVESHYRVHTDRKHRAMAGLSMGGGQTINIGIPNLEKFAYLGVFSSGVFGITGGRGGNAQGPSFEERHKEILDNAELKKGLELMWFATGTDDFLIETSRATVEMFKKHEFDVTYEETSGGHTWINWRLYLRDFSRLLFKGGEAGASGKKTASAASAASKTATVAGEWAAEFDTQIGVQKYVYTFAVDGGKLTGTARSEIQGEKREAELSDGALEGATIRFTENLDFGGNAIRIEYTGKVSGDTIELTRRVGDFATEELVAKRSAAAAESESKDASKSAASDTPKESASAPAGFDRRREDVPRGTLETLEYESKSIGMTRKLVVYTPPGYTAEKKYPVLYLLHGIGDIEADWSKKGSADVILDNLHADGKVEPMLVVMPNGRAAPNVTQRTPWGEQFAAFAAFEKDLLEDVIPFIEGRYSVQSDRKARALAGLSMGGGQSLNFGLGNLDTFAWVGGFSSAPNTKRPEELLPDPERTARELELLWVSCGDADGLMRISKGLHDALEEAKVPHAWHVDTGGHTWSVWKNDLYLFSQRLFR